MFMPAAVAWALSGDFFIPLKVVHAASFAALFALKPNCFSESRHSWGLSARCCLRNLTRRVEYCQLDEVLPK